MEDKDEDQRWLDGLAGRSEDGAADTAVQTEARLIRQAMLRQSQPQERGFETTEAGFQKLVDAAKQQGMLRREPGAWSPMHALRWMSELSASRYSMWTIAATLVAGIALIVQFPILKQDAVDESNLLRGGTDTQQIIVADLEVKLKELQSGLTAAGTQFSIKRGKDGSVVLIIPSPNEQATAFLVSQRIEAVSSVSVFIELRPLSPAGPK